ncbi:MAG: hypothetical protein KGZ58_08040 [Ignavibacteriales bacterium]|nr:hypothetical protein [Ignavibacteriales bacterium]
MSDFAYSVNNIPIRLPDERWIHIVESHEDMAGYYFDVLEAISKPTWIVEGDAGELWAIKNGKEKKVLLVIYREFIKTGDGFVITAFFTTQLKKLLRRDILWHQPQ